MKSSENTALREALKAVTALASMAPSMAINAQYQLSAPGPLSHTYAGAGASVMSVLLAAGAPFVLKRKKTSSSVKLVAMAAFVVCAGYNLSTAVGSASINRSDASGAREANASKMKLLAGQVAQAEASRVALAAAVGEDTAAMIDATLQALRQDARWYRSEGCVKATKEDTRAFCADYARKLSVKSAAEKVGALDVQLAALKEKLIAATNSATGQASDPQADNVARALGMIGVSAEAAQVGVSLNLWFALTIEVLAALGPIVFSVLFSGGVSKKGADEGAKEELSEPAIGAKKEAPATNGCKSPTLSMVGGTDATVTAMVAASSAKEVAARLGVSERTIWRKIAEEKSGLARATKTRATSS